MIPHFNSSAAMTGDLPPDIIASKSLERISTHPRMVLLTGATGFLGIFLLAELLEQDEVTVCCLVRADDEADGKRRIEQVAAQYNLALPMGRCVIVVGSLAQHNLGLPPGLYQHLAQCVDAIWHCGAYNDHVMSYNRLRASNVHGTVEVLRFAVQFKLKPVHFISTYATGYGAAGIFKENTPLPTAIQMLKPSLEAAGVSSGYVLSKWVAEHLVLKAASRGLPVTIQRPARILPCSRTGASNPNDLFTRLLVGCIQLGEVPSRIGGNEYGAPVDQVASASVALGLDAQVQGRYGSIFHLFECQPISATTLIAVAVVDHELAVIEHAAWIRSLQQSASNVLRPLLHEVEGAVPVDFLPTFDSTLTLEAASRCNISVGPSLDYQHSRQYLAFLRRLQMLPQVSRALSDNWLLSTLRRMHESSMAISAPLPTLAGSPSILGEIECICMACDNQDCDFHPVRAYRRPTGEWDVHIKILYCGVCHSDLTIASAHQGVPVQYPIVPGHEAVGICIGVGARVTSFKAGDHVGVGNMVDSCSQCRSCLKGDEQWCSWMVGTYNDRDWSGRAATGGGVPYTLGGYSTAMVVHERFCIQIPPDYPLEHAGPVMCAGTTMYGPLKRARAGPGTRLGIVGLGGLGTMGLKLGKALGCSVTIMSRGESKRALAMRLGADQFVATNAADELALHAGSLDLIINTIPTNHDPRGFSTLLSASGKQALVGIHAAAVAALANDSLSIGDARETMSFIGGVSVTQEVMDLCAHSNILTEIEVRPVSDLNRIFEALDGTNESGKRFVLDIAGSLDHEVSTSPPTQLTSAPSTEDILQEYSESLSGLVEMIRRHSGAGGSLGTPPKSQVGSGLSSYLAGANGVTATQSANRDDDATKTAAVMQQVADVLHGGIVLPNCGTPRWEVVQLTATSEKEGSATPLSWFFNFAADGTASMHEGHVSKPTAKVDVSHEILQGVAGGGLSVTEAYWGGKLQVEGSIEAAKRFGAALDECRRHVRAPSRYQHVHVILCTWCLVHVLLHTHCRVLVSCAGWLERHAAAASSRKYAT